MPHFPKPFFRESRNTWYVQINQKQINLGSDEPEAFRKYHEIMGSLASDGERSLDPYRTISLTEVLDRFLIWTRDNRDAKTYDWYKRVCESFETSARGNRAAKSIRKADIDEWVNAHKWSGSTTRDYISAIKRAYAWASGEGEILDASPIASVRCPRAGRRDVLVDQADFQKLVKGSTDDEFRDILHVSFETGCRPEEVRTVEARHVDLKNGWWKFEAAEQKTGDKTAEPRIVYLTEKAAAICERLIERFPEGPIFRNSVGEPWTGNAVRCRMRRMRKRLGLNGKLCHYNLRHTYATDALENGVGIEELRVLLGHSDPTMIVKHYSHLAKRRGHMREVAKKAKGGAA